MASLRRSPFLGRSPLGSYRAGGHRDGTLALQSISIPVNESLYIGSSVASRFVGVPPITAKYLGSKTLT